MAAVFQGHSFTYCVGQVEAMSSAPCPEGQENWILSNKESQKTAESNKNRPPARGLAGEGSKQWAPSSLFGKHQAQVQAY